MYEVTNESKKTMKGIVNNLNETVKAAKTRTKKLKSGKAKVKMPSVESGVGHNLEEFAEKQVKTVKTRTKKLHKNMDVE